VADAAAERIVQRPVVDVAEGVVGHQSLRRDAVLGEVGECALDEGGHGRCLLVVVELDVGEPGVVVDDHVRRRVTRRCAHADAVSGRR
jgi:hypothetical protein